jgi:hypothetical protein
MRKQKNQRFPDRENQRLRKLPEQAALEIPDALDMKGPPPILIGSAFSSLFGVHITSKGIELFALSYSFLTAS